MTTILRPLFVTMFLISFVFAGVTTRAEDKPADSQQVKKLLSVDEFKQDLPTNAEELDMAGFLKLQEQGKVVVLDVRGKESFDRRHLKGSINAPLTDLTEKNLPTLVPDKNTPVVLVCDYSFMPVRMIAMTMQAYPVLKANGYTSIYRLNLWQDKQGGKMHEADEQEKALAFEGSEVKPREPEKKE